MLQTQGSLRLVQGKVQMQLAAFCRL